MGFFDILVRLGLAMDRYETFVEDGTVYVGSDDGPLEVAPLEDIVAAAGGPAWTITYSEAEKERYAGMDTSDEGLVVDVVDMLHAMTHSQRFVDTLAAHPTEVPADDTISPRAGLFVGKLLENLEHGVA
ncbi:hypothetical protein GCM10009067_13030 [Haloarcula sebkhae]|uniref:Uncharacterized protein n=3 Tax=Haloarcula TaxID=2237 RepID=A0A830ENW8_9EURY|nr:hypothetical protein GCM10009067_13030 [Haloarcula sebkhae]